MTSRPKLLLVDDSVSNIEVLAEILSVDHDVRFATSGLKALQMLKTGHKPDLLLLDVMMPGMDGYELCSLLKHDANLQKIPVIFITASADANSESLALASGAVDFIHKPINRDVLLARVKLHLGLIQQREELESLNARLVQTLLEVERSRDQLQILATAMEYSPTSIVVTDTLGNIEYVNPHFCKISGYSSEEVIGQTPSIVKSGLTPAQNFIDLWTNIRRGDPWSGEFINANRNGTLYREEAHIAPVKDLEGRTSHYVAIQLDVTARHEAEELIQKAREKELQLSAAIQQELLFGEVPSNLSGFTINCYTAALQVIDGDFYTVTRLGPSTFEILSGDVMGKGMTAALVGAGVKNAYREAISDLLIRGMSVGLPTPEQIINEIHARVADKLIDLGVFVTLTLLRFDHASNTMTWVNAGHTPTLLVRPATGECLELLGDNLPLGVTASEEYRQHQNQLQPGDVLCIYSDGMSEAENNDKEQFGSERINSLLTTLAVPGASLDHVLDGMKLELNTFLDGTSLKDDTTVILVQAQPT